ncbi:hypothetical protein BTVI_34138 [Pitangus sulphuratus]|nr:hypothetical protein BTVI_34138 [Pitangus sulphuratus]
MAVEEYWPACEKVLVIISSLMTLTGVYSQISYYDYACRRNRCNLGYSVHMGNGRADQNGQSECRDSNCIIITSEEKVVNLQSSEMIDLANKYLSEP